MESITLIMPIREGKTMELERRVAWGLLQFDYSEQFSTLNTEALCAHSGMANVIKTIA